MSGWKPFGDLCQNHPVMTAPTVYPYDVIEDGGGVKAFYRCSGCGASWPVWWSGNVAEWENAQTGDAA